MVFFTLTRRAEQIKNADGVHGKAGVARKQHFRLRSLYPPTRRPAARCAWLPWNRSPVLHLRETGGKPDGKPGQIYFRRETGTDLFSATLPRWTPGGRCSSSPAKDRFDFVHEPARSCLLPPVHRRPYQRPFAGGNQLKEKLSIPFPPLHPVRGQRRVARIIIQPSTYLATQVMAAAGPAIRLGRGDHPHMYRVRLNIPFGAVAMELMECGIQRGAAAKPRPSQRTDGKCTELLRNPINGS